MAGCMELIRSVPMLSLLLACFGVLACVCERGLLELDEVLEEMPKQALQKSKQGVNITDIAAQEVHRYEMPCKFTKRASDKQPNAECQKFVTLAIQCQKEVRKCEIAAPNYNNVEIGTLAAGKRFDTIMCGAGPLKLLGHMDGMKGIGEAYAQDIEILPGSLPCMLTRTEVKLEGGEDGLKFTARCEEEVTTPCLVTELRTSCLETIHAGKEARLKTMANSDFDEGESHVKLTGWFKAGHEGEHEGASNKVSLSVRRSSKMMVQKSADSTSTSVNDTSGAGKHEKAAANQWCSWLAYVISAASTTLAM